MTVAAANGPVTFKSASARAVSVSLRATSTLSAFSCRSRVGSVSLGNVTRPVILNGPPASSPPKRSNVRASRAKLRRALKLRSAGSVAFVNRATFTVMSPAPLNIGRPMVPLTSTSNPSSPSNCSISGTNWRTKFTELRGRRAFAVIDVSSGTFRARAIFGISKGMFALISSG